MKVKIVKVLLKLTQFATRNKLTLILNRYFFWYCICYLLLKRKLYFLQQLVLLVSFEGRRALLSSENINRGSWSQKFEKLCDKLSIIVLQTFVDGVKDKEVQPTLLVACSNLKTMMAVIALEFEGTKKVSWVHQNV